MPYYPYAPSYSDVYWLVSPDGNTIARFNGDTAHANWSGMLTDVSGLDSPEVRESAEDLVEADGGVHGNFWLGRRPIVLNGQTYGYTTIPQRNTMLDRITRASLGLRGDSELHWVPNSGDANLIQNFSFETNPGNNNTVGSTTGWVSNAPGFWLNSGAAISPVTTQQYDGKYALQIVTATTANQGAAGTVTGPFQAGVTYNFSVYAKYTSGSPNAQIFFGDASANSATAVTTLTGNWARYNVSWTPTATVATAYVGIRWTGTTASTGFIDYAVAAPGNSPPQELEMMTWVRRQQPVRYSEGWSKTFQIPLVSQYARMFSALLHYQQVISPTFTIVVENQGSYPALPTLRVFGPITDPLVTNTTNSKQLATTAGASIANGSYVDFDMLNHTATLQPAGTDWTDKINFLTTTWPTVDTGNNSFTVAGTGTGAASGLGIIWRDTWV